MISKCWAETQNYLCLSPNSGHLWLVNRSCVRSWDSWKVALATELRCSCSVAGLVLHILCTLTQWIFTTVPWGTVYYLHFIDEETEARNGGQDHTARPWIWAQKSDSVCAVCHSAPPAPDTLPVFFPSVSASLRCPLPTSACDVYFSRLFSLTSQTPAL